ncbi:MAG: hypothetical protein KDA42_18445 [Planctomycetales bacterium]|nr:hypothetical protein [Planctomycetales bacterium]
MVRYLLLWVLLAADFSTRLAAAGDYAIVVSAATQQNDEWAQVTAALRKKYDVPPSQQFIYTKQPEECLVDLRRMHPRYTCFVVRPDEATREFIAQVHQLTRRYDDDPYADTLWGVLTGFDAACACRIAEQREPLVVRKVASGTEVALDMCHEGLWYDELVKNKLVRKDAGQSARQASGPDDTTQALVDTLNDYQADLFVTSGHATERDWMIGFRYRNGFFRSRAGQMYGQDSQGKEIPIDSPNPKVYLPIGNCLMGHIDGRDSMALAWMNDVGVRQMIGYTVPTWFGYAGWGCLDYFVEQPGRYTLAEAFMANQHALIHRLETAEPDSRGLQYDRDVVAFYGDPKWEARMESMKKAYDQELKIENGDYVFTITPRRGDASFQPINTNGSQRGWRPIVAFLPHRVANVRVESGADLQPTITDDFVLIPNPKNCDPQREYRVVFHADPIE